MSDSTKLRHHDIGLIQCGLSTHSIELTCCAQTDIRGHQGCHQRGVLIYCSDSDCGSLRTLQAHTRSSLQFWSTSVMPQTVCVPQTLMAVPPSVGVHQSSDRILLGGTSAQIARRSPHSTHTSVTSTLGGAWLVWMSGFLASQLRWSCLLCLFRCQNRLNGAEQDSVNGCFSYDLHSEYSDGLCLYSQSRFLFHKVECQCTDYHSVDPN